VNPAGVLLDTGPLVALLSKADANHARARYAFAACAPPFRCCEADVVALGRKGVYEIALPLKEEWPDIERLLRKYADRPASLAHACLIRCAERHQEPRLLTFDTDFDVYRWGRHRRFEILTQI
jgi:predicted nucleic acid-binding protein